MTKCPSADEEEFWCGLRKTICTKRVIGTAMPGGKVER